MIQYWRFCHRVAITDGRAIDGGELLATEDADGDERRQRFAGSRITPYGDWFEESPSLLAHIRALRMRHHSAGGVGVGERLIRTPEACLFTGQPRQVLYRWARERRITRYGDPGAALWDPLELPGKGPSGAPAKAPPRRA